jgi:uncharacterized protein (TIGR03118 family)
MHVLINSSPKSLAIVTSLIILGTASGASLYTQTNLVSDVPGLAPVTDSNLVNPWGVSFAATSPFWVSDQGKNVSTLYNAAGVRNSLVVSTPGGPTGQVFNSTSGFAIGTAPSTFIFSTLSGTIQAWNGAQGTTAAVMHTTPGGSYTGLTLGQMGGSNVLFAANKATGKIDVFDSSFNPLSVAGGAFTDPSAPAGLTPYNVQIVGGKLFVEYSGARGAPGGFVAAFDPTTGALLQHITSGHLNAPWGIAMAPTGFGDFGNDLLIGNFNDGQINAFDLSTGNYLGTLTDTNGNPIANPGLWALDFRVPVAGNANTGPDPNSLFFVAGINNEQDGLFGRIDVATPEPASVGTVGFILLAGFSQALLRRRARKSAAY